MNEDRLYTESQLIEIASHHSRMDSVIDVFADILGFPRYWKGYDKMYRESAIRVIEQAKVYTANVPESIRQKMEPGFPNDVEYWVNEAQEILDTPPEEIGGQQ